MMVPGARLILQQAGSSSHKHPYGVEVRRGRLVVQHQMAPASQYVEAVHPLLVRLQEARGAGFMTGGPSATHYQRAFSL